MQRDRIVTPKSLEIGQRGQDKADNTLTMGLGYEKKRHISKMPHVSSNNCVVHKLYV